MQLYSHASSLSKSTPRMRHLLVPMLHKLQRVLGLLLINLVVDKKVGRDALANYAAPIGVGTCDLAEAPPRRLPVMLPVEQDALADQLRSSRVPVLKLCSSWRRSKSEARWDLEGRRRSWASVLRPTAPTRDTCVDVSTTYCHGRPRRSRSRSPSPEAFFKHHTTCRDAISKQFPNFPQGQISRSSCTNKRQRRLTHKQSVLARGATRRLFVKKYAT